MSDIIKTQRSFATKAMYQPAHRFDHLYRIICQQEWIEDGADGRARQYGSTHARH